MNTLKNKVAIVTGAASGIGKATALLFALEGAKIVVSDITEDNGKKAVAEIKNDGGDAIFVKADTSQPEEHKELIILSIIGKRYWMLIFQAFSME